MVGMLGVLAIIGVLSIGGIAGYRYAMAKHKVNELFEDIELERVYAMEEMNKENPTGYVSETQNSGYFTVETNCGVFSNFHEKCFTLRFYIRDTDVCKQFIKQAPEDWLFLSTYSAPPRPIKIINCSLEDPPHRMDLVFW